MEALQQHIMSDKPAQEMRFVWLVILCHRKNKSPYTCTLRFVPSRVALVYLFCRFCGLTIVVVDMKCQCPRSELHNLI